MERFSANELHLSCSVAIALTVGAMLGFTDSCVNTQIYSFLTIRYPGQTRQAFALHKLFHVSDKMIK